MITIITIYLIGVVIVYFILGVINDYIIKGKGNLPSILAVISWAAFPGLILLLVTTGIVFLFIQLPEPNNSFNYKII